MAALHSFVGKFVSLWASGKDVTLRFNSKAGKANVTMELELGEHNANVQSFGKPNGGNFSRQQRRRDKRFSEKTELHNNNKLKNENVSEENCVDIGSPDIDETNMNLDKGTTV